MRQIKKLIQIDAPKERVWEVLLGTDTYPEWTKPFSENSSVTTDWQEGSAALFTDHSGSGMVSRIVSHVPNEHITIEHMGILVSGVEDYESDEARAWRGALESYFVTEIDGITMLIIESDVLDNFFDILDPMWDKAILIVKELAEKLS